MSGLRGLFEQRVSLTRCDGRLSVKRANPRSEGPGVRGGEARAGQHLENDSRRKQSA